MRIGSALYFLILFLLHTALLFAPAFIEWIAFATQGILFLALSMLSILSMLLFSRERRPTPSLPWIAFLLLIAFQVVAMALFIRLRPESGSERLLDYPYDYGWSSLAMGISIHFFAAFMSSAALWMRRRHERFQVVRRSMQRPEVMRAFTWKMELQPSPELSHYRYQELLRRSFGLLGLWGSDLKGRVELIRIGDDLYIYDLMCKEGAEESLPFLLRSVLVRGGLKEGDRLILLLPDDPSGWLTDTATKNGFILLNDEAEFARHKEQWRRIFGDQFEGWSPFAEVTTLMVLRLDPAKA